jgi:acyl-coenzyme A synthetase/AMP-(fatty) acid ligase
VTVNGDRKLYREIEDVLRTFPGILDVMVTTDSDEKGGTSIKVLVVMREGITVEECDIMKFCSERLPDHMKPRSIDIYTELPKKHPGKVSKRD